MFVYIHCAYYPPGNIGYKHNCIDYTHNVTITNSTNPPFFSFRRIEGGRVDGVTDGRIIEKEPSNLN